MVAIFRMIFTLIALWLIWRGLNYFFPQFMHSLF
jgi:hypothetical protein